MALRSLIRGAKAALPLSAQRGARRKGGSGPTQGQGRIQSEAREASPALAPPVSCGARGPSSAGERPDLPLPSCKHRLPCIALSAGVLLTSLALAQIRRQGYELRFSPRHGGPSSSSLAPVLIIGAIFPHGIDLSIDRSCNGARLDDKAWEHEPLSSFRETTAGSSLA
jgi:hypothetical protein